MTGFYDKQVGIFGYLLRIRSKGYIIGKKGANNTVNQERAATPQEMRLWEKQADQMEKATAVAQQQEARSQQQDKIWRENYLRDEVMGDTSQYGDPEPSQVMQQTAAPEPSQVMQQTAAPIQQRGPSRGKGGPMTYENSGGGIR